MKFDNCKDCQSGCEHAGKDREFVCPGGVSCKVTTPKPKTYTIEELAKKICDSYDECTEGECPGYEHCNFKKRNGTLVWLRGVLKDD